MRLDIASLPFARTPRISSSCPSATGAFRHGAETTENPSAANHAAVACGFS
jgi:hypothetical protein